jgi:hypothetical protein
MRFTWMAVVSLALGWVSGFGQPAAAPDPPPLTVHAAASYAIYSLLLADSPPTPGYPLAIAGNTLSASEIPAEPRPDLTQAAAARPEALQEALEDYQQRGAQRAHLQHALRLNRPYMILSGEETARFRANPGTVAGLPASTRIAAFSQVYFDRAADAALVYMTHLCASPCGTGEWAYFVNENGQWFRASRRAPDEADVYAVYSLVMPGVPFSQLPPSQAAQYAIAAETVAIDQMNPAIPPDAQLRPPAENQRGFREALEDFYQREHQRALLEPRLKLDRPYRLLSPAEVSELRNALTGIDPGSELKDKWAGYAGITFFSEVYFNAARTAALVYMSNWCASLCSNGQWLYLEKRDGGWTLRSGLNR